MASYSFYALIMAEEKQRAVPKDKPVPQDGKGFEKKGFEKKGFEMKVLISTERNITVKIK